MEEGIFVGNALAVASSPPLSADAQRRFPKASAILERWDARQEQLGVRVRSNEANVVLQPLLLLQCSALFLAAGTSLHFVSAGSQRRSEAHVSAPLRASAFPMRSNCK